MSSILIKDTKIVNEGISFTGNVLIENSQIKKISSEEISGDFDQTINGKGFHLIP